MHVPKSDFRPVFLIDYYRSVGLGFSIYSQRYQNIFGQKAYSLEEVVNYTRHKCIQAIVLGEDHFKIRQLMLNTAAIRLFWEEVAPLFVNECEVEFLKAESSIYTIYFRDAKSHSSNTRQAEQVLLFSPTKRLPPL